MDTSICKPCKPRSTKHKLCEHNIRKEYCKDCGGSALCEHDKRKSRCRQCKGSDFCKEHNRLKSVCVPCGGASMCEHAIRKIFCNICDGSGLCKEHGKRKYQCKECGGSSYCKHGKRVAYCAECGGSELCFHGKSGSSCIPCKGRSICKHNKNKYRCKDCDGRSLCKSEWCSVRGIPKYNGYCLTCCIHLFPDIEVCHNYKTKEKDVVDRILVAFPDFIWVHDKRVQDGCSKRRPDLLLDLGTHIIIVEIDENKHTEYDCSCENKRLMELSQDLNYRPIVFIRFNPDGYVDKDGKKITSCWISNFHGVVVIKKSKQKEWGERIDTLKQHIQYWIDNLSEKTIEIIELFY